jgi:hypothetical protein
MRSLPDSERVERRKMVGQALLDQQWFINNGSDKI